jgi:hypothetical protein
LVTGPTVISRPVELRTSYDLGAGGPGWLGPFDGLGGAGRRTRRGAGVQAREQEDEEHDSDERSESHGNDLAPRPAAMSTTIRSMDF